MRIKLSIALCILFITVFVDHAFAQLRVFSIGEPEQFNRLLPLSANQSSDTLLLPFLDDFSSSFGLGPDLRWWTPESRVWVNRTMGINAPSIGVATFDGADPTGRPYLVEGQGSGFGDSLISKPINLAMVPNQVRNTVVLSFFWQKQGRGEMPDAQDIFQLLFKRANGQWQIVWQVNGLAEVPTDVFQYQTIAITDPAYFHSGFQFIFRSSANKTGPFDTWNLDYVWLDQNRRTSTPAIKDRAITGLPKGSFFGDYTLVTAEMARNFNPSLLDTLTVGFINLDSLVQPIEYSAVLVNKKTGQVNQNLNDGTVLDPIPQGFQRRDMMLFPPRPSLLPQGDSLAMELRFILFSGDQAYQRPTGGVFPQIDFRQNDTLSIPLTLAKNLAYDDGTAEFSIGLSQNGGSVLIEYAVQEPDILSALDVHFPFIPGGQENRRMEILIMSELGPINQNLLASQVINIPPYAGRDQFTRIKLFRPVAVNGRFYIGWRHIGNLPVAVGLDNNNAPPRKLFTNTRGIWEAEDDVKAALMFRPVLDKGVIQHVDWVRQEKSPFIFPNPADDRIYFATEVQGFEIYDLNARLVQSESNVSMQAEVSFLKPGMYLIKVRRENSTEFFKFVKR